MNVIVLRHKEFLPADLACQLSRAMLTSQRPTALHTHDFPELIWVQNGRIREYGPKGHTDHKEGTLLFVRPTHAHALQGKGEDAMVVSIAFDPKVIEAIGQQYPQVADRFFWGTSERPETYTRDMQQMADLNRAAVRLERRNGTALDATAFLLPLLSELIDETVSLAAGAPRWLAEACAAARNPDVFRDGAAGFVRVTGRAHAHVSRTARQFLGQSPSEYVNGIRMDYAGRQLIGSTDNLAEIAADCGIPNLSHFHKLFLAHHGMTPAQFRKTRQRNTVQPVL